MSQSVAFFRWAFTYFVFLQFCNFSKDKRVKNSFLYQQLIETQAFIIVGTSSKLWYLILERDLNNKQKVPIMMTLVER